MACPFGVIEMVTTKSEKQPDGSERVIANKCDLCANVPGGPACVRTCPTDALQLVEEEQLLDKVGSRRLEAAKSLAVTKEF